MSTATGTLRLGGFVAITTEKYPGNSKREKLKPNKETRDPSALTRGAELAHGGRRRVAQRSRRQQPSPRCRVDRTGAPEERPRHSVFSVERGAVWSVEVRVPRAGVRGAGPGARGTRERDHWTAAPQSSLEMCTSALRALVTPHATALLYSTRNIIVDIACCSLARDATRLPRTDGG